jgi:HemX protein
MDTDALLLLLATLACVGGVVHAVLALRAGSWKNSRLHWLPLTLAFLLLTGFLYLRGQANGRCPLTTMSEVLIFIGWCIVMMYLLVGPAFRLSLLGVFTAPLVAMLLVLAQVLPPTASPRPARPIIALLELHAAVSLIAYAAFALACVTGVMYLLQERLLKKHQISKLFYQLPPISGLARAIQKLIWIGLLLLSAGLAISFALKIEVSNPKIIMAWIVWGLYALVSLLMWRHVTSPRQTAWLAAAGFAIPFFSLWIVTHG